MITQGCNAPAFLKKNKHMSTYEQKRDQGSLFKNDRKEKEGHPDYKGSANIEGLEYWVSAWVNTSKDGKKYMSLKFQVKEGQNVPQPPKPEPVFEPLPEFPEPVNDLPF